MQAALTISKRHCLCFLLWLSALELRQSCLVYLMPLKKCLHCTLRNVWECMYGWLLRQIPLPQSGLVQADLQATPCILP